MYEEIWNWKKCKTKIATLRGRLGFPNSSTLRFLKLSLSLTDGHIYDELKKKSMQEIASSVFCILDGYADSKALPETGQLISFAQVPGGRAYYNAFVGRAVRPIRERFGSDPKALYEASRLLGAERLNYGDCSFKIYSLPLVPISIVLYSSTAEFAASASILFDSSASNYLSTEQIAMLSQLTSARLRHAAEAIA